MYNEGVYEDVACFHQMKICTIGQQKTKNQAQGIGCLFGISQKESIVGVQTIDCVKILTVVSFL